MSKSNKQVIEDKKALQNEFSDVMNSTNSLVASWISSAAAAPSKQDKFEKFFALPIIPGGAGLTLDNNDLNLNSIEDNIKNRKSIKVRNQDSYSRLNITSKDSATMKSLKNQIKRDKVKKARDNLRNGYEKKPLKKQVTASTHGGDEDGDSEDEEYKLRNQRSAKKASNVLFGAKVGKNKKK